MEEKHPPRPPHPTPMMQIIHLSKLFRDQLRRASEEAGVPCGYRMILMELSHCEKATQYELAKRTHLTAPTVSVTLQKMEHEGYIVRVPDENDLRQMQVSLTEKGVQAEADNRARANELEQALLDGFSEEDRQTLVALLTQMEDNLHHKAALPPPPISLRKEPPNETMV
ncbi:MAG: MarR family transcriptional regulator [Clostridia bacterium]|nr:MarR family transcriptional regulator [Clostridia bacterium]